MNVYHTIPNTIAKIIINHISKIVNNEDSIIIIDNDTAGQVSILIASR